MLNSASACFQAESDQSWESRSQAWSWLRSPGIDSLKHLAMPLSLCDPRSCSEMNADVCSANPALVWGGAGEGKLPFELVIYDNAVCPSAI